MVIEEERLLVTVTDDFDWEICPEAAYFSLLEALNLLKSPSLLKLLKLLKLPLNVLETKYQKYQKYQNH